MALSLKVRRSVTLAQLKPYFKAEGFYPKDIYSANYVFRNHQGNCVYEVSIGFLSSVNTYSDSISIPSVESVILEVGIPTNDLSAHRSGENLLITVDFSLKKESSPFTPQTFETEEGCVLFAKHVINYYQTQGLGLWKKYNHLPTILAEMEESYAQGHNWRKAISASGPECFFRGLIISRLCNDPRFSEKQAWVDSIFYDEKNRMEDWHTHYEHLKKKLEVLLPTYN